MTSKISLLIIVLHHLSTNAQSSVTLNKPGVCPKTIQCNVNGLPCFTDAECDGNYKCCDDSCGNSVCVQPQTDLTCNIALDLGFILETSTSITPANFRRMKTFLKEFVKEYNIREGQTHVAGVAFGDTAKLLFNFNELQKNNLTLKNLTRKIDEITQVAGADRLDLALEIARDRVFSFAGGQRDKSPRILIIVTDGIGDQWQINFAEMRELERSLKGDQVEIFVVAVGDDVKINQFKQMASGNGAVYNPMGFNDLRTFPREVALRSCKACSKPVDIGFVIPSNTFAQFEDLKDFMKRTVDYVVLGFEKVHIGLLIYHDGAEVHFKFNDEYDLSELKKSLNRVRFVNRDVLKNRLDLALNAAANELFTLRNGVRQDAPKKLIVVGVASEFQNKPAIFSSAEQLRSLGVDIIGVAYGSNVDTSTIRDISSFPLSETFKIAPTMTDLLIRVPKSLVAFSCKSKNGKCPYTKTSGNCPLLRNDECTVDNDCLGDSKCCIQGCNRQCITPRRACFRSLELAFLVDTSVAVNDTVFQQMKDTMKEVVNDFSVSEIGARISIIAYDKDARILLNFKENVDFQNVIRKIEKLDKSENTERHLDLALLIAQSEIFSMKAGRREGVPAVLIVLNGGTPSTLSKLNGITRSLKNSIDIWSINSGPQSSSQYMRDMASSDDQFLQTTFLENLNPFISRISQKLCSDKPGECPRPQNIFCLVQKNACEKDHECPGYSKCCYNGCRKTCLQVSVVCDKPLDLAILLESSRKLGKNNIRKLKVFTKDLVNSLISGNSLTEIALLSYSSSLTIHFGFNKYKGILNKRNNIMRSIDRIMFAGNTNFAAHLAIKQAYGQLFTTASGSRFNAVKAVVLITDGNLSDPKIISEANELKRRGVSIFPVAISKNANVTILKTIASDHVFLASSALAASQYLRQISLEACKANSPPVIKLIKGPQGEPGRPGPKGNRGLKGLPGNSGFSGQAGRVGRIGTPGAFGRAGPPGFQGPRGSPGPIFIQMAGTDSNGRIRRVMVVPSNNVGQSGIKGRQGIRGARGKRGDSGLRGSKGETGTPGRPGQRGPYGSKGVAGRHGDDGSPGRPGTLGDKGERGEAGKSVGIGEKGHMGLKGNKGLPGIPGDLGDMGKRGEIGVRGRIGKKGAQGIHGFPGQTGSLGTLGDRGKKGGLGSEGTTGPTGNPGMVGAIGRRGIKGFPGPSGRPGHIGFQGQTGSPGLTGFDQPPGNDGIKGNVGKPGRKGSMGDRGPSGVTGPASSIGSMGFKGSIGPPGMKGRRGNFGRIGMKGVMGSKGSVGDLGLEGIVGDRGSRGKMGDEGDLGLAGLEGIAGEMGIQGSRGFTGSDGKTGKKGVTGGNGKLGLNGRKGTKGRFGKVGPPGSYGKQGSKGRLGRPGNQGRMGIVGLPGDDGEQGELGLKGIKGYTGSKGTVGLKGQEGPQGSTGPLGPFGDKGEKGMKGHSGDFGMPGFVGLSGELGERGLTGEDGLPGAQGSPGELGVKGMKGLFGDKGPSGEKGILGLNGEEGKIGDTGKQGLIGEPGLLGVLGETGNQGPRGLPGLSGLLGKPGKLGDLGVVGLLGEAGRQGTPGEKGEKGDRGMAGVPGLLGYDGDPGVIGAPGLVGNPGSDGIKGASGIPGLMGAAGKEGLRGKRGIAGDPGPIGESGISGPPGIYGGHGEPGIIGIKGEAGLPGGRGLAGFEGDQGKQGAPGPSGSRGERGRLGSPGIQGAKGAKGYQGHMGIRGETGPEGIFGKIGDKGSKGDTGIVGDLGVAGTIGLKGVDGKKGNTGENAPMAQFGLLGLPGFPGSAGSPGDMGLAGYSGVVGEEGNIGLPGVDGKRGKRGPLGKQGLQGLKGVQGGYGGDGLQGDQGPPGFVGDSGSKGMKGVPGEFGSQGDIGPKGIAGNIGGEGLQGIKGIIGDKGDRGSDGVIGRNGARGLRGRKGITGSTGSEGVRGEKGAKGEQGPYGFEGPRGDKGVYGDIGEIGNPGRKGFMGEKGHIGSIGEVGKVGEKGIEGQIGITGLTGNRGRKGVRGNMGPPGPPGPSGEPGGRQSRDGFSRDTVRVEDSREDLTQTRTYYHGDEEESEFERESKPRKTLDQFEAELLAKLHGVLNDFALYRKPTGTREFPALTCKSLFNDYSHLKSGIYWLDPNEGVTEDAVKVYCNAEKRLSCIKPQAKRTQVKQWYKGSDRYLWFKQDIDENFNFRYSVESNQLTFLQLHSDRVKQTILYHCINSTAWYNASNDVINSIKLLGDNEREYGATTARKNRPIVIEDGCRRKTASQSSSEFEIDTYKTSRLPIRDIAVYDIGDDGEKFGLELGDVCFS